MNQLSCPCQRSPQHDFGTNMFHYVIVCWGWCLFTFLPYTGFWKSWILVSSDQSTSLHIFAVPGLWQTANRIRYVFLFDHNGQNQTGQSLSTEENGGSENQAKRIIYTSLPSQTACNKGEFLMSSPSRAGFNAFKVRPEQSEQSKQTTQQPWLVIIREPCWKNISSPLVQPGF